MAADPAAIDFPQMPVWGKDRKRETALKVLEAILSQKTPGRETLPNGGQFAPYRFG